MRKYIIYILTLATVISSVQGAESTDQISDQLVEETQVSPVTPVEFGTGATPETSPRKSVWRRNILFVAATACLAALGMASVGRNSGHTAQSSP